MRLNTLSYSGLASYFFTLLFILFSQKYAVSQLIDNSKGKILQSDFFFNSKAIQEKNIKTIEITFFEKKELQGINQVHGKSIHFFLDTSGRIKKKHETSRDYYGINDTVVEWRFYKKNRLSTIKQSTDGKELKVISIFYEENLPSVYVLGISTNESRYKTKLQVSSYREQSAEYINHKITKNGDSLTEWSFTDKTVFKRRNIHTKDSLTRKETFSFPLENEKYFSAEFHSIEGLLVRLNEVNSDSPDYYYTFHYRSDNELMSFSKYSVKWGSEIEVTELLYSEENGNLEAILTKNKINNSIKIRKFNYTYF
ncbi:MAG: hypothetical protein ABF240_07885 [Flavobacteriales bacterium]